MLEKRQFETVWSQKYRPAKVSELILPQEFKTQFQSMVDKSDIQNCLLVGNSGMGKSSTALAMLDEIDADYLMVNMSMSGTIDTLRTTIQNYATSVSMTGKKKYVILDELSGATAATQDALKGFIEEFSRNVGFIATGNHKFKIIPPLLSRFAVYDFDFSKEEKLQLMVQFNSRVKSILTENNVQFDPKTLALLLKKYFPDFRKILNELQRNSQSGSLSTGVVSGSDAIDELVGYLKDKNFTEMRKWVAANSDIDFSNIQKYLYEKSYDIMKPGSIPQLVLHLAEYDYRNAFVIDKEINTAAMLLCIMSDCEF